MTGRTLDGGARPAPLGAEGRKWPSLRTAVGAVGAPPDSAEEAVTR